jgi:hypothetical protein
MTKKLHSGLKFLNFYASYYLLYFTESIRPPEKVNLALTRRNVVFRISIFYKITYLLPGQAIEQWFSTSFFFELRISVTHLVNFIRVKVIQFFVNRMSLVLNEVKAGKCYTWLMLSFANVPTYSISIIAY